METAVLDAPQTDAEILNTPDVVDMSTTDTVVPAPDTPVETPAVDPSVAPASEAQAPAEVPEEEEFPSSPSEALTVRALNEHLAKNPAIQQAVNSNPAFKNLLYSTARLANTGKELKSVFANVDTARTALQLAQQHSEFQQKFAQGGPQALEHLAYTKNPDGSLRQGANGQPEVSPAYLSLVKSYREMLYAHGEASGDPKVVEAVATLAAFMRDREAQQAPAVNPDGSVAQPQQVDPVVQSQLAELARYREQDSQRAQYEVQQYHQSISDGVQTKLTEDVSKVMGTLRASANIALTPYMEKVLTEKILAEVHDRAAKDPAYQQHAQFVYNTSPRSAEGREKVIGAARSYAKNILTEVVRKHLTEISQPVLQTQTEKAAAVAAQASRPNPRGAGGVAHPSRPDPAAKVTEFIAQHKRRPSELEILNM